MSNKKRSSTRRLVQDQWIPGCPDIVMEGTMAFCLYLGICFLVILPLLAIAAKCLLSALELRYKF